MRAACQIVIALSVAFVSISVGILALRLSATVTDIGTELDRTLETVRKDADDLKQMTNATLFQVGDASHEVADMAREEKSSWQKSAEQTAAALTRTNAVLDQLSETIQNADKSQAAIASNVNQSLSAIPAVLTQSQATLAEAQVTVNKAGLAIDAMNKVIQDPSIPATLASVNATADHLEKTSASVDVAVARLTKPRSLVKSIIFGGLDSASKIAILVK